jgi:hypothetical protein
MYLSLRRLALAFAVLGLLVIAVPAFAQQEPQAQTGQDQGAVPSVRPVLFSHLNFDTATFRQAGAARPAQSAPAAAAKEGVGVGIKGGPTFSTAKFKGDAGSAFSGATTISFSNGTLGQLGLFFDTTRGMWGAATELNVVMKRLHTTISDGVNTETAQVTLTQFQMPVFLRVNGGGSGADQMKYYIFTGPAIDIRFRAKIRDAEGLHNAKDDFEIFDFEYMIGGGVEVGHFVIEGRYGMGLRNIAKDIKGDQTVPFKTSFLDNTIKSRSANVLFGWRFR